MVFCCFGNCLVRGTAPQQALQPAVRRSTLARGTGACLHLHQGPERLHRRRASPPAPGKVFNPGHVVQGPLAEYTHTAKEEAQKQMRPGERVIFSGRWLTPCPPLATLSAPGPAARIPRPHLAALRSGKGLRTAEPHLLPAQETSRPERSRERREGRGERDAASEDHIAALCRARRRSSIFR